MRARTVLILGAGASHNYGYPVGSDLRLRILRLGKQIEASATDMQVTPEDLRQFIDEFSYSQMFSIDAFLARRMEFAQVGKAAIAKVLLECEHVGTLFDEAKSDHWYRYLLNILANEEWGSFDPSWLSVVTFNYDRSLEAFLYRSLQAVYAKSEADVRIKLLGLKICHVYGDLAALSNGGDGFGYASETNLRGRIQHAAKRLRVIPEGRDDEPHLEQCKNLIAAAERVCFLGFGFDPVNLRRIGAPDVFLNSLGRAKHLAATAFGLTDEEKRRAVAMVVGEQAFDNGVAAVFRPEGCLRLLRESLILG